MTAAMTAAATSTATTTATMTAMFCRDFLSFTGKMDIIAAGLTAFLGHPVRIGGDELTDGHEVSMDNIFKCSYSLGKHAEIEKQEKGMDIFVHTIEGKHLTIAVDPADTIAQLKQKVMEIEGIHVNKQKMTCGGKLLQNDVSLSNLCGGGGGRHIIILMSKEFVYYKINKDLFDPQYNYEYPTKGNSGDDYKRGGKKFQRPYGCEKYALKVIGKFTDDVWLGTSGCTNRQYDVSGEWPVSYHGTKVFHAESIIKEGLKPGTVNAYGVGVYSSPSPDVVFVDRYAERFSYNDVYYRLAFMNRANMDGTKVVETPQGTYYVTKDGSNIRPYAILIKKC